MVKPTNRHYLEWFSAAGDDPLLLDSGGLPYVLQRFEGFSSTLNNAQSTKSPQQQGETFLNNSVRPRVLTAQVAVDGEDYETYWRRRSRLAETMVSVPSRGLQPPPQGLLRLYRPHHPLLQVRCVPQESPKESARYGRYGIIMDIEWHASQPWWEEPSDRQFVFVQEGSGFHFELEHEWHSISNNVEQDIFNPSHMAVPIRAMLHGPGENARLVNVTTGDIIELEGVLLEDEHIEIRTEFGQKSATLVNETTGDRTNAMDRVNFDTTVFWQLQKRTNTVRFEMDINEGGWADLRFRARYGGV